MSTLTSLSISLSLVISYSRLATSVGLNKIVVGSEDIPPFDDGALRDSDGSVPVVLEPRSYVLDRGTK